MTTLNSVKKTLERKGFIVKSIEMIKKATKSKIFKIVLITGAVIIVAIVLHDMFIVEYVPALKINLIQRIVEGFSTLLSSAGNEIIIEGAQFNVLDPELIKEGAKFILK